MYKLRVKLNVNVYDLQGLIHFGLT